MTKPNNTETVLTIFGETLTTRNGVSPEDFSGDSTTALRVTQHSCKTGNDTKGH